MIRYKGGRLVLLSNPLYFLMTKDVFKFALKVSIPNMIMSGSLKAVDMYGFGDEPRVEIWKNGQAYTAFSFLLGLMVVFRTSQCYARFWDGCTLLYDLRADILDAASSLMSFSTVTASDTEEVQMFRHKLVRLFSMLHALILSDLEGHGDDRQDLSYAYTFNLVDPTGIDAESLEAICQSKQKAHLVFQWIQNICVLAVNDRLLSLPPPILTRAFQELSRGMLRFQGAMKYAEVPFPYPYLIASEVLLVIHFLITPFVTCIWATTVWSAAATSFFQVFVFWSLDAMAKELEHPYGSDANDLDMQEMQENCNFTLVALIDPKTSRLPQLTSTYLSCYSDLHDSIHGRHDSERLTETSFDSIFRAGLREVTGILEEALHHELPGKSQAHSHPSLNRQGMQNHHESETFPLPVDVDLTRPAAAFSQREMEAAQAAIFPSQSYDAPRPLPRSPSSRQIGNGISPQELGAGDAPVGFGVTRIATTSDAGARAGSAGACAKPVTTIRQGPSPAVLEDEPLVPSCVLKHDHADVTPKRPLRTSSPCTFEDADMWPEVASEKDRGEFPSPAAPPPPWPPPSVSVPSRHVTKLADLQPNLPRHAMPATAVPPRALTPRASNGEVQHCWVGSCCGCSPQDLAGDPPRVEAVSVRVHCRGRSHPPPPHAYHGSGCAGEGGGGDDGCGHCNAGRGFVSGGGGGYRDSGGGIRCESPRMRAGPPGFRGAPYARGSPGPPGMRAGPPRPPRVHVTSDDMNGHFQYTSHCGPDGRILKV
eukprot:NODE_374_length_3109_cov_9.581824.p1 GENE.NODE_374_length_3109_cov_9.581824~~NODE_374_length_3109_cov_9.581824.p1  ORF type:complete len:764 (+),score=193.66 NODE_374_length_3109_cov_9.581824:255-2546(+)